MLQTEEYVHTSSGNVLVNVYGNKKKHPIITFHDIGLNGHDNFHDFFIHKTGDIFGTGFCIYNINAPFQETKAPELAKNYKYPSVDNLVHMIGEIVHHYDIKSFIGLGVGAGAYLLLKYAVLNPNKLDALILINCVETKPGWVEWAQEKLNVELLEDLGMTHFTQNYLIWHHLGGSLWECPQSEILAFKEYFNQRPNPTNVAEFINSYLKRTDIDGFLRNPDRPFKVPILQIVGDRSAFLKDVEYLETILDPKLSEVLKIYECGGNVLDERPDKVAEAILLFLQGNGFIGFLNVQKAVHEIIRREVSPTSSARFDP